MQHALHLEAEALLAAEEQLGNLEAQVPHLLARCHFRPCFV